MTVEKKSKRRYIAGLAQLRFKVENDWEKDQAFKMFSISEAKVPKNKIVYGNCIEGMKLMPEESVDLVIADPPFGIDFSGKGSQYNRNSGNVVDGYVEIDGSYDSFSLQWISCLPRIMKKSSSAYIISGWTNLGDILYAIKKSGLIVLNHIIWKYQFGVFTKKKFVTSHYHILFLVKDVKSYFFNKYEYYPEDVWYIPRVYKPGQLKNGTKLPEALINRIIQFSSKPGDLVFDPFMGNATTAVCSKGLFRNYYGFELNKNMKDIHEKNISSIKLGEFYKPLNDLLPTPSDLIKKYPYLKKYINMKDISPRKEKSDEKGGLNKHFRKD
ncbi:MAG: DNA-methyltransferase [Promethearchaeota archaeon]